MLLFTSCSSDFEWPLVRSLIESISSVDRIIARVGDKDKDYCILDRSLTEIWAKEFPHVNLKATPTLMRSLRVWTSRVSTVLKVAACFLFM